MYLVNDIVLEPTHVNVLEEVEQDLNFAWSELLDVLATEDTANKDVWTRQAMQFIQYAKQTIEQHKEGIANENF